VFQHPIAHNLEWRAVVGLLGALGSVEEHADGKLAVEVKGEHLVLQRPKHKDVTDAQEVLDSAMDHLVTYLTTHDPETARKIAGAIRVDRRTDSQRWLRRERSWHPSTVTFIVFRNQRRCDETERNRESEGDLHIRGRLHRLRHAAFGPSNRRPIGSVCRLFTGAAKGRRWSVEAVDN
jgi:hypothetical protein